MAPGGRVCQTLPLDNMRDADLKINAETENIGFWQFERVEEAIAAGEKAARLALQQDKHVLFHASKPQIEISD